MINRSDKKAFYGIIEEGKVTFTRMKYFTELSLSKNPKEYARQYIDEDTERTDVTGYSPSMSYSFDDYRGDAVLEDIVDITNSEKLGLDAQREIVQVDFSRPADGGGYYAVKRTFSVIADSEGDSTDAYTYSGTFKTVGTKVVGVATIATPDGGDAETVQTITFAESAE